MSEANSRSRLMPGHQRMCCLLSTFGSHKGENLCKLFVNCLDRFVIPLSKVSSVTMDNAPNNDTFMEFLEKHSIKTGIYLSKSNNRIRCLPHVLNLAVQDILSELKIPLNHDEDSYAYLDDLQVYFLMRDFCEIH